MRRHLDLALSFVILLCIVGPGLGCLQDPRCAQLYSQSQAALQGGNMTAYCLYTSQKIACDRGDTQGCTGNVDADIQTRQNIYHNNCSLTASDVASCQLAVTSCATLLQNASQFSGRSYSDYCAKMSDYVACVAQNKASCKAEVTIYDVLGSLYAGYDKACVSATPQYSCQLQMTWSCLVRLVSLSNTSTPEELCSVTKSYMDCQNEQFRSCDSSVKKSDVLGFEEQEASYTLMCQAGGLGPCPGIASCINMSAQVLSQESAASGQPPEKLVNLMNYCSTYTSSFSCINTQLTACSLNTPGTYNFQALATLYSQNCPVLMSDEPLKVCSTMNTCLASLTQPSRDDLDDIIDKYFKPQFWCSIMKSTLACASDNSGCSSNGRAFYEALVRVEQFCPDAPLLVAGQGSPGAGHVTRAELSVLFLTGVVIAMLGGRI